VNVFDRFLIHPVERSNVVVELVRRFVDQVKAQQRRALTKIVRHGNPPVNHLFFGIRFRVVFIFIGLISDDGDDAVLLAGLHQLTQVNQPRFRRFARHPNTDMVYAFHLKITDHQRVELADTALGACPVDIHSDAQHLRVTGSRQRRLSGNRPAGRE